VAPLCSDSFRSCDNTEEYGKHHHKGRTVCRKLPVSYSKKQVNVPNQFAATDSHGEDEPG
jgi:hypothetical protein